MSIPLKELANRMFNIDLMELASQAVEVNEKVLTDLNRDQMLHGLTAAGAKIKPDLASDLYADAKKDSGGEAPFGTPDLFLTGSFQEEMQMDIDSRSYSFFSTDDKATKLNLKYKNIFGLTAKNKEKAKVINGKTLNDMFRKAIGV
jgi:hypothetical protein